MATERTPLQSPHTTVGGPRRVQCDEYGYDYVDDDGPDGLELSDDDDDDDEACRQARAQMSEFFRPGSSIMSVQEEEKQRTVAHIAYTLLALLVLFFVWSSLHSASQSLPVSAERGVLIDDDDFFCGLKDYEAGYIKLANKKDDDYFYWYIQSSSAEPSKDPLVLWLTGGPGVPSTVALLSENGPCLVQPDGMTTKLNPYAWTNAANVIWLDQPTNVGFSYGVKEDADSTETNVGENIFWFLEGFFDKHPELQDRAFFITGESYGGHYVPAAAHYILAQMKQRDLSAFNASTKSINLKGIAIGNGLVDAAIQFPRYIDMADNAYNITFVNAMQLAEMKELAPECEKRVRECQANLALCADAQEFCQSNLDEPFTSASQRNPFDIRKFCIAGDAQTCNSMDHVAKYLNLPDVRSKVHVNDENVGVWTLVKEDVQSTFTESGDAMVSYSGYVADLLNDGIRVLVYTGDADLACNWLGSQAWTREMQWEGKAGFNAAEEQLFVTNAGVEAGIFRTLDNRLTFLRVFNSGHMVPQDQPVVALDMIDKFLRNVSL